MKKRINSRSKGARAERRVIELLKAWTGFEFSRVPSSGGLRWGKTENITGDIVCSDERHKCLFSFEVKSRAEIDFSKLVASHHKAEIWEFWEQCKRDADRGYKIPLLLFRMDGLSPADFFFLAMSYKHFKRFKGAMGKYPYIRVLNTEPLVVFPSGMLFEVDYPKVHSIAVKIFKKEWPERYKSLTYGL